MARPVGCKDSEKRKDRAHWTLEEERFLKENYFNFNCRELQEKLHKSRSAIIGKAKEYGFLKLGAIKETDLYSAIQIGDKKPGIGILIHKDGRLHLSYGENGGFALFQTVKKLREGVHSCKKLQNEWNEDDFKFSVKPYETAKEAYGWYIRYINGNNPEVIFNTQQTALIVKPKLSFNQKKNFLSKINIGTENDCWEWQAKTKKGYGEWTILIADKQRTFQAHKLAYYLFTGILTPLYLCHSCDNPPCCNPKHLIEGTPKFNYQDSVNKGRQKQKHTTMFKTDGEQFELLAEPEESQVDI